jgi:predicted amidohydrolase
VRVFLVQHALENLAAEGNRARVEALLAREPIPPASLIALPELFSVGILTEAFGPSEAKPVEAADRAFLSALARRTASWILGSTVSARSASPGMTADALANLSVLVDPAGETVLEYAKLHPFSLGGEDRVFAAGDAVRVHPLEGFTLQATVCYDLRFPELYRAGMRRGADLIGVQANWPESRREHWEVLLRARAIENQSFVAGVNCAGTQRGTLYAGGSRLVSPKGEVLAQAGADACVVSADIAAGHVKSWRRTFPVLRDRKAEGFWKGVG